MPVVRRVAKPFGSSLQERYWPEIEHLSNRLRSAVSIKIPAVRYVADLNGPFALATGWVITKEAVQAFPFTITHVLTDRGSCFTADGFEATCRKLAVQHRTTRPYTPKTNGMVERFNGRVQREVLGITIHSHADLETLLKGFNRAYNARRQRVLGGLSPDEAVRQRMKANPKLASPHHEPPLDPCVLPKALLVVQAAKEVSHPDI